ncbi:MAG: alkaline phosphatase family protein [Candidatus Zipacnadales bacterium]
MFIDLRTRQIPRLLQIGIDGADYNITEWLMERGYLPTLCALAEAGAWGPMRSTVPPLTPPAWTTLMTGKNPGKHGVFDFLPMTPDKPVTPLDGRRRATSLWRALSERGYRVGTFNLPMTYPPEPLSGFQVAGFMAPSFKPTVTYPEAAFGVLQKAALGFAPFPDPSGLSTEEERRFRDRIDLVPIATRHLLRNFPCDVCMVNFQVVDWAQHRALAKEMSPGDISSLDLNGLVARTYRLVDDRIGILLREWATPETHVMVVSDHGGAVVNRLVNLEKLFVDSGLLVLSSQTKGGPATVEAGRRRARLALAAWKTLKRTSPRLTDWLAPLAQSLRGRLAAYQRDAIVDWSRSQAVPWGLYGEIRLNLCGRERSGIVRPSEVPVLKARIRELILSVRDPVTHRPVYQDVVEGAQIYSGPYVEEGRDLVALPSEETYMTICGRMFRRPPPLLVDAQNEVVVVLEEPQAFHSLVGIFFMAGPDVKAGVRLPEVELVDWAPTALYLLDEPVPSDMDGEPVLVAIQEEVRNSRPLRGSAPWLMAACLEGTYTAQEQQEIERQLAALGYI